MSLDASPQGSGRPGPGPSQVAGPRAFVDLHCHTAASFDSLASWPSVIRAAQARGLTHLAITDHDRIDAALAARDAVLAARDAALAARDAARSSAAALSRDAARSTLEVIVGEECRTADGDLICLFLSRPVPPGLSAAETIAAVREQGGLVGIPHPFDRLRTSLLRDARMEALAGQVDWVETYNARLLGSGGNERAAAFALQHGLPGVACSDAHSVLEVGVACTALDGDPSTPDGLRAALSGPIELVTGRASYLVRAITPVAKVVQWTRGNGRVRPGVGAIGVARGGGS